MLTNLKYLLLLAACTCFAQQASLHTNFGLSTWDYHQGPVSTLNAQKNRLVLNNFKELSVWDLEHFVVLKNISLEGRIKNASGSDAQDYRIQGASISPSGKILGYQQIINTEDETLPDAYYILVDLQTGKEIQRVVLEEPVRAAYFDSESRIIIRSCINYCEQLRIQSYDLETGKLNPYEPKGREDLIYSESLAGIDTGGIRKEVFLDRQALFLVDYNSQKRVNLEKPAAFDPNETYATDVSFGPDNTLIFKHTSAVSLLDANSGTLLLNSFPTAVQDHFNLNGKLNPDAAYMLYVQENAEKQLTLYLYHLKTKTSTPLGLLDANAQTVYNTLTHPLLQEQGFNLERRLLQLRFQQRAAALQAKNYVFGVNRSKLLTVYNDGSLLIFDAETGKQSRFNALDTIKPAYSGISHLGFFEDLLLMVFITSANQIELISFNLEELQFRQRLSLPETNACDAFTIIPEEQKAVLQINSYVESNGWNFGSKGRKDVVIDLNTFKVLPVSRFEDQLYDVLYYTNSGTEVVGYKANRGSAVYEAESFKPLKNYPNQLYFKEAGKVYFLEILKDSIQEERITDCWECEDFFKTDTVSVIRPTGLALRSAKKSVRLGLSEDLLADLETRNTFFYDLIQEGSLVHFQRNGNTLFTVDLKKEKLSETKNPSLLPQLKTHTGRVYLQDIQENANTFSFEGEEYTYGSSIRYTSSPEAKDYRFLEVKNASLFYDFEYLSDRYIATRRVGRGQIFSINSETGLPQVLTQDPEMQDMYVEADLTKNRSFSFINFETQTESSLILDDRWFGTPPQKLFLRLGDQVFFNDSLTHHLHRVHFEASPAKIESRITPLQTYLNFKPDASEKADFTYGENDGLVVLKTRETDSLQPAVLMLPEGDIIIAYPDNYFMGTRNIFKYTWYAEGEKIYRPEQFDLRYNRPDIVLERLGYADSTTLGAYKKLYENRLKKMGFNNSSPVKTLLPKLTILNRSAIAGINTTGKLQLDLSAVANGSALATLHVWINNVPIYGVDGIALAEAEKEGFSKELHIDLAEGSNTIQVSVHNTTGIESTRETLSIDCFKPQKSKNLYLVSLGVSSFIDSGYNLKYAAKDARDIVQLFQENPVFDQVQVLQFLNEEVTPAVLPKLRDFVSKARRDDVVMVFLASHGLLTSDFDYYLAGNKTNFDNPAQGGISYEALDAVLDGIAALSKILILDACHSGELEPEFTSLSTTENADKDGVVKSRGAIVVKTKASKLEEYERLNLDIFTDLRRGSGAFVLSSAGGAEFAYEGDQWNNGLFTYSFINGIKTRKADLNADTAIMLNELQEYVSREVKRLSEGRQTPAFRSQNIALDYRLW
ncbi:caspase family protein [Leeuwenhoekiella parthenopeia]|uniref:Caspase family protein n=1 Tax=Leeuwenhoekiella parthenopeia TaxID=2890320 RepID=A0ABS8GXF2_9FLAO|nr:caspase family protein [Leeuwenhoekiella parthenopeia]MCC4214684.1 caspase family protein [Leeuwenhoekiella parthenopeia]